MARSKPSSGSTAASAPAVKLDRKGNPKVGRLKKLRTNAGMIRQAYTLTAKNDPKLPWLLLITFVAVGAVIELIGILVGLPLLFIPIALLFAVLATLIVFGRRAQGSAYRQVEGQPGAAAWVLEGMRGDWRVTPAVGFTREQDLVHRVIGKPGVILVAEGARHRTRGLIGNEKRKVTRIAGSTPVYDVHVGDGDGEVPLRGLEKHFLKLPHNIKPKVVNELDRKFTAMGGPAMPIPKGPMPRGGRVPRR